MYMYEQTSYVSSIAAGLSLFRSQDITWCSEWRCCTIQVPCHGSLYRLLYCCPPNSLTLSKELPQQIVEEHSLRSFAPVDGTRTKSLISCLSTYMYYYCDLASSPTALHSQFGLRGRLWRSACGERESCLRGDAFRVHLHTCFASFLVRFRQSA